MTAPKKLSPDALVAWKANQKARIAEWKSANPDRVRASNQKYKSKSADKIILQNAEYRRNNRIKRGAQNKEWRENNPEVVKRWGREWKLKNRKQATEAEVQRVRNSPDLQARARIRAKEWYQQRKLDREYEAFIASLEAEEAGITTRC